MASPKHRLSILAGILGLNALVCPPLIFGATIGSYVGDGSLLQLNDGDIVQADAVTGPGTIFYGLHADPNNPSNFNLKNGTTINVGPAPVANTKFS